MVHPDKATVTNTNTPYGVNANAGNANHAAIKHAAFNATNTLTHAHPHRTLHAPARLAVSGMPPAPTAARIHVCHPSRKLFAHDWTSCHPKSAPTTAPANNAATYTMKNAPHRSAETSSATTPPTKATTINAKNAHTAKR